MRRAVGADRLDGGAAGADHDPLLGLALHEERDTNVHGPFGFAILLHLGRKCIGQLVLEQLEGGLAEVLHGEEARRLGADVVGVVGEVALGQMLADAREQPREAGVPVGRGDDEPRALELGAACGRTAGRPW